MSTLSENMLNIFLKYTVKDIIINQYKSLQKNNTIKDAIKIILSTQQRMIIIFDKTKIIGWLTKQEIVKALFNKDEEGKVSTYMCNVVEYIDATCNLSEARVLIQNSFFKTMVVLENNQTIGIIDKENLDELLLFVTAKKESILL